MMRSGSRQYGRYMLDTAGAVRPGEDTFVGAGAMVYQPASGFHCGARGFFPDDLTTVSDQTLEVLHLRLCREVDFEYFFERRGSPSTRLRYLLLQEERRAREKARLIRQKSLPAV